MENENGKKHNEIWLTHFWHVDNGFITTKKWLVMVSCVSLAFFLLLLYFELQTECFTHYNNAEGLRRIGQWKRRIENRSGLLQRLHLWHEHHGHWLWSDNLKIHSITAFSRRLAWNQCRPIQFHSSSRWCNTSLKDWLRNKMEFHWHLNLDLDTEMSNPRIYNFTVNLMTTITFYSFQLVGFFLQPTCYSLE